MSRPVLFSPRADGMAAALLAPLFMTLGFFLWDAHWTKSGASAFSLNMFKCTLASGMFVVMCLARGFALPSIYDSTGESASEMGSASIGEGGVFTMESVGYLTLSSVLGIIVGDVLWLEALRLLGPRHVIVIDSVKPFAAALLGWAALDERLLGPAWGGMVLTVAGVGAVTWEEASRSSSGKDDDEEDDSGEEAKDIANTAATGISDIEGDPSENFRNEDEQESKPSESTSSPRPARPHGSRRRGYACAVVNVLADSLGSLLTKQHGVGMTTWAINLIRFGFAGAVCVVISLAMRAGRHLSRKGVIDDDFSEGSNVKETSPKWYELPVLTGRGWAHIVAGVVFVTFLCPALSNHALFLIPLGLAVSLGSVGPLYGLALDWPFRGRRSTVLGVAGAIAAVGGVVVLCVWGRG
ncbi:hypothetical protein THAOC_15207 [Thalassiosira oceanica]|uniref:EamA domain-containing protein n=1 Tax=Thalassiosira oceanica TaxID=159749 RepID=K0SDB7_THAOC|nr:hypothetical protein THAOC_15207 [Thalassiosira oceanica]|eukprot:EJK64093.1 hypothetical protein THAOC_15207 [Thalassiosira oceanica]